MIMIPRLVLFPALLLFPLLFAESTENIILASHKTNGSWSFHSISQAIQDDLKMQPNFGNSRRPAIRLQHSLFAADLALVALSVRTGYLVDVAAPQEPLSSYSRLLGSLRNKCPLFYEVVHVFEPASEQSFFVHASLMRKHVGPILARDKAMISSFDDYSYPKFVLISAGDKCSLLPSPPSPVIPILRFLINNLPNTQDSRPTESLSVSLPEGITHHTAVPLAAILLDYPVAYVPEASEIQTSGYLANVALDIYECYVMGSHTLLRFSCPETLGKLHPTKLSTEKIKERLTERFVDCQNFRINRIVETLDRVAL